jgi:hypothetical protein
MEAETLKVAAQWGLPAVLLFVVMWRQREDSRECREDRNRLWSELVRLAYRIPAKEKDNGQDK